MNVGDRMKRLLAILTVILVLTVGFIGLKFGSALTQEGNPVPYLKAIIQYELSGVSFKEVVENQYHIRYVSGSKEQDPYRPVKDFMKNHGWAFKEQIGSGLVFVKDGGRVTVETRQYSESYDLWDVPKEIEGSNNTRE
ncbi:hypothetical protein [Bacillus sp. KH172YL63]|uniref:hypothetical protein n=1 Tax=Bacillus sp. KH172YL63 TaxID=2709784 RepID=UPI0013E44D28|nr:hypothetical protein [Bacillus sp. KH172YL63]BCB04154.1 hypothetical protein KH172YL63_22870 [Bacillus sp. KH172YL63]